jgi:site-specific DNA-methyltransferase (adenine-specific)
LALKELGETQVPVIRLDDLTDEQRRAYTLVHNQLTMNSGFDLDTLKVELDNIGEIDMSEFGFSLDGIGEEPQEVQEDDFDEEPPEEPISKLGDIYQLGDSRLMCGDSTNAEDVAKLMDGHKADLCLTDPPYGVKMDKGFGGSDGFSGKGKPIKRREYTDDWDGEPIGKEALDNALSNSKQAIIFGGNFFTDNLPVGKFWIVWDKLNTMPSFGDCELAWTNIKRNSVKKYEVQWNGLIGKEKQRYHPTQKPLKLIGAIVEDFSEEGDNVLDLFGGSGSTLIACEQLNRKCYMMEMSPKYVDVIIKRWEEYTGKKAVKIA